MKIRKNKKYFTTLTFLLLLTTVSALVLSKSPNTDTTNAAGASILAGVTVDSVCTMSGSVETNQEHVASVHGSSYTADIGETTIRVNCNDGNGYAVYAVGFTNDTEGTNTLEGNYTGYNIPTGTGTSTTTSNWAMKLTSVSGTSAPSILSDNNGSFASYHSVPDIATKVVSRTSNTTSPSEFKTTYAVAVSGAQPADTYTGQVKYTLVHPSNANPDGTINIGECDSPNTCMQTFTASMCETQASDAPVTLTDARDGKTYTVRYIEGACWMTQNLRITGTVSSQFSNFSTYDSVNVCEGELPESNYDEPRCHDSGNTANGVWYNYAAATAKTITNETEYTKPTEDICPAGWKLPSYDTNSSAGSINSLISTSETSIPKFAPTTGGHYNYGTFYPTYGSGPNGYWWTDDNNGSVQFLLYEENMLRNGYSRITRGGGCYIRCVLKS